MDRKKLTVLLIVTITCVIIWLLNVTYTKPEPVKTSFNQKEVIIDDAQFIITPVLEVQDAFVKLSVRFNVTSYINSDILDLDFKHHVVLNLNGNTLQPYVWKIIEKGGDELVGQLIFKLKNSSSFNSFGLTVFTLTDHEINWD